MGARARGQDGSRPASAIDRLRLFRAYVGALRAVWLPAYVAASYTAWSPGSGSPQVASLTAFAVIGLGGAIGCLLGGRPSDRGGRAQGARAAVLITGGRWAGW